MSSNSTVKGDGDTGLESAANGLEHRELNSRTPSVVSQSSDVQEAHANGTGNAKVQEDTSENHEAHHSPHHEAQQQSKQKHLQLLLQQRTKLQQEKTQGQQQPQQPQIQRQNDMLIFKVVRFFIYATIFMTVSVVIVLPWSIFQFHKFYNIVLSPLLDNNKIIIPLNFNYENPGLPPFVNLNIRNLRILDLISTNTKYDLYLRFNGYCGRLSSPDLTDVALRAAYAGSAGGTSSPYSFASTSLVHNSNNNDYNSFFIPFTVGAGNNYEPHKEYAVKLSILDSEVAKSLINQHQYPAGIGAGDRLKRPLTLSSLLKRSLNQNQDKKQNLQASNRIAIPKSSWPVTNTLPLIESQSLSGTDNQDSNKQIVSLTSIQSLILDCSTHQNENKLIPPILKAFLPPFIYQLGLPKTSYTPPSSSSSSFASSLSSSFVTIKLLSNLQIDEYTASKFNLSDFLIEFNDRILINNFNAFLEFRRLESNSFDLLGIFERHKFLVHVIGTVVTFSSNVVAFFIGSFVFYGIVNKLVYSRIIEPQLARLLD